MKKALIDLMSTIFYITTRDKYFLKNIILNINEIYIQK